jgi:hypothetical protein
MANGMEFLRIIDKRKGQGLECLVQLCNGIGRGLVTDDVSSLADIVKDGRELLSISFDALKLGIAIGDPSHLAGGRRRELRALVSDEAIVATSPPLSSVVGVCVNW